MRRLAVDSGRIATEDANGNITLREADAVAIWHRSFKQKLIRGLALDASRLTVMTTRALVTYDVTSGRRLTTWPLPKDSAKHRALLDMSEGIAVYRDGKTLHSLRVSDGRDIIVASPSHGPVYAQIESSGLFYSFTVPGAERPGRVAFVAFEDLLNALGPT